MRDKYRREMEQLRPSQEALDRLYTMIEKGPVMNRQKRLSGRAAAVLVCAALMVMAAAAAAPTIWEALLGRLGVFAPYARTIEGAVCSDQGIELRVLSSLSDDLEARVYLSVRDMEGDRLDQCLTLTGRLTAGMESAEETPPLSAGSVGTGRFQLLSYDSEAKTALFSASIYYGDSAQPVRDARLSVTDMSTQGGNLHGSVPCAAVTGQVLESLPAEGEVIFRPSDIDDRTGLDSLIPTQPLALAPEQNPIPIEGTEDMWISSMGFAADGCFHIRLGLAEGVRPEEQGFFTNLFQLENDDERLYTYQQTLVDGGMDILFPLLHPEDLALIQSCVARLYGPYTRYGTAVEGSWIVDFQMSHYSSVTLAWTGELAGRQVRQVTVSPLSVTMRSSDPGGFHGTVLYAVKTDGSSVAAAPDTGRYSNAGQGVWDTFNTWKFEEPVNVADIAFLSLAGETIPVN